MLLRLLKSKASPFKFVVDDNIDWYMAQLTQEKESKLVSLSLLLTNYLLIHNHEFIIISNI